MRQGSSNLGRPTTLPIVLAVLVCSLVAAGCGSGGLTGRSDTGSGGGGGVFGPGGVGSGNWTIETVDQNANAGHLSSIAINSRGTPSLSYFASSDDVYWVRYASYDGWFWQIETIHETDTKAGCPLAIDPSGNPTIAYVGGAPQALFFWPFQSDLILARSDGTVWQRETVDEENVVGLWSSVAYDGFDHPGISYQDLGNGIDYQDFHLRDLKFAYFTGTTWLIETVEEDGGGYYTKLFFDQEDQPAIAYCGNKDEDSQPVKFAHRGDYGWEIHTVDAAGECAEGSLSARMRPGGGFGIAYYDERFQDLKYATYFGGFWHIDTIESHNKVGKYCSLAYGTNGEPVVSYYYCGRATDTDCQGGGDLRVARHTQTGWVVENVDTNGNTGLFTSLEVTSRDEIFVAYYNSSQSALKMARQR